MVDEILAFFSPNLTPTLSRPSTQRRNRPRFLTNGTGTSLSRSDRTGSTDNRYRFHLWPVYDTDKYGLKRAHIYTVYGRKVSVSTTFSDRKGSRFDRPGICYQCWNSSTNGIRLWCGHITCPDCFTKNIIFDNNQFLNVCSCSFSTAIDIKI